ncbi:unnamed protein product [Mytilus edulis]|uniref:Uncharacterized protein n=1 Tax=Mytilus edulis TaxID=6550 RepID=A0A8S3V704_MYTED|nr:unnamed protein product [Mytilus edulis]
MMKPLIVTSLMMKYMQTTDGHTIDDDTVNSQTTDGHSIDDDMVEDNSINSSDNNDYIPILHTTDNNSYSSSIHDGDIRILTQLMMTHSVYQPIMVSDNDPFKSSDNNSDIPKFSTTCGFFNSISFNCVIPDKLTTYDQAFNSSTNNGDILYSHRYYADAFNSSTHKDGIPSLTLMMTPLIYMYNITLFTL